MKRIFFMFLVVIWANIAGAENSAPLMVVDEKQSVVSQTNQQNDSALVDFARDAIADVYVPMQQWAENMKQIKPEQVDIKKVNPLTAMYLTMTTDVNFLTGMRGYTEWQTYPFGRMRLVSCRAGLKQNTPVFLGVQAQIHSDWALVKPVITLNTPAEEVVISYPLSLNLPKGVTRTFLYDNDVIFPIFFVPKSYDKSVDVMVQAKWRALNPYTQQDILGVGDFQMPLTLEQPYETGICPHMMSFLNTTPAPVRDNLIVSATLNHDKDIQLFFEMKQPTETLSVQVDDDWTFTEEQKTINGKTVSLVIKPSEPLQVGDTLPLKVITSFGIFDVPTVLKEGTFLRDIPSFRWGGILVDGLWLFLLTPLFSCFLLQTARTPKQLKNKAGQTLIFILTVGVCWTIAWQAGLFMPVDLAQLSPVVVWITLLILLWWMVGVPLSLGLIGLLIIFLPKPYLADSVGLTAYYPFAPMVIGTIWTALALWPFVWVYRYPEAFVTLHALMHQDKKALLWLVRLPALIVIVWLGIGGGIISFTKSYEPYSLTRLKQAVASDNVVFVSLRPPICFSCTLIQTSMGMSREAQDLKQKLKLVQMVLPADSFEAKELIKRYGQLSAPMNLLYGPKQPNGILLPTYVDYAEFSKYLNLVK